MKAFVRPVSLPLLSLCIALWLAGCMQTTTVRRPSVHPSVPEESQAGLSLQDRQRVESNCLFGMPKGSRDWNFGPTDLVARDGYVLLHSATDKIPFWVSEHLVRDQLNGSASRANRFQPDPKLLPGRRAELADYKRSGYDRGHLAPAGDQTKDERLKAETFYLSNMAPQVPAMNQQIWRELEDLVRRWIIDRGEGFVITGSLFYSTNGVGSVKNKIGSNGVAVPTHFYKIVVARDASQRWQAIAFVMDNRVYVRPFKFEEFIRSVDWIEQRTGLDFLPELDPVEEERLERTPSSLWH